MNKCLDSVTKEKKKGRFHSSHIFYSVRFLHGLGNSYTHRESTLIAPVWRPFCPQGNINLFHRQQSAVLNKGWHVDYKLECRMTFIFGIIFHFSYFDHLLTVHHKLVQCCFLPHLRCLKFRWLCCRLWKTAQRNEDESQSNYCPTDVWSTRCGHKRLDRRDIFYPLEENTEGQER